MGRTSRSFSATGSDLEISDEVKTSKKDGRLQRNKSAIHNQLTPISRAKRIKAVPKISPRIPTQKEIHHKIECTSNVVFEDNIEQISVSPPNTPPSSPKEETKAPILELIQEDENEKNNDIITGNNQREVKVMFIENEKQETIEKQKDNAEISLEHETNGTIQDKKVEENKKCEINIIIEDEKEKQEEIQKKNEDIKTEMKEEYKKGNKKEEKNETKKHQVKIEITKEISKTTSSPIQEIPKKNITPRYSKLDRIKASSSASVRIRKRVQREAIGSSPSSCGESSNKTTKTLQRACSQRLLSLPFSTSFLVEKESTRRNSIFKFSKEDVSVLGASEKTIETIETLHRLKYGAPQQVTRVEKFQQRYTITYEDIGYRGTMKDIDKVILVVEELLETERGYLMNLKLVYDLFLKPIREREILSQFEIISLFSNIETVIKVNHAFLEDLESIFEILQTSDGSPIGTFSRWIGEIFEYHCPLLQPIYATYCTNQPTIENSLQKFKENNRFSSFLKSVHRNSACKKQEIESFLISPLQRLCRYPLFIKEIIKHTPENSVERPAIDRGYQSICKCVNDVNLKVKQVESLTKLTEVVLELSNGAQYYEIIVNSTREFIMKDYMVINDEIRNVYLFNHFMLITKQTPPELKLKKNSDKIENYIIQILFLYSISLEDEDKEDCCFEIGYKDSTYVFQMKDMKQKDKWIETILEYKEKAPKNLGVVDKESRSRSRTIELESPKPKSKKFKSKHFSITKRDIKEEVQKLQSDLRNEHLRRKIEEDNTKTYKQMYDDLEGKYNSEMEVYARKVAELKQKADELKLKIQKIQQTKM